ncbi:MAG: exosortase/archaeosortase family protein [Fimbriimonadaceae bacterium]|nr:exosortase/archaeosortase family protein [Fimbriimonadaceae bacterium]QYK57005.1 MAG: exosortase/archaeosortase family protein [Fimbriimonadaceae bacterium]
MSLPESTAPAFEAPIADVKAPQASERRAFNWQALLTNKVFLASILVLAAVVFCFAPLIPEIKKRWLDMDGYYAHGLLIPLCAAYLIWDKWDRIKEIPVKGVLWMLVPMGVVLYISMAAARAIMPSALSVLLVIALGLSVVFLAGWRWLWATLPSLLFLLLGFPVFDRVIDSSTMPLQIKSTSVAYYILKAVGLNPLRLDPTVIHLDNFDLNVAAACSGLKTTIAVSAAVIFFMLIAKLRWWANLLLAAIAIPLSLIINGVRISMIGMVGNSYGHDAGMQFHDYSGYIALAMCFLILGWITKKLGYK